MRIDAITIRQLRIPMRVPLRAAHGELWHRDTILVEMQGNGLSGWGECVALNQPVYSPEWSDGEYILLHDIILPSLVGQTCEEVRTMRNKFVGHSPAHTACEIAAFDAHLKSEHSTLADAWNVVQDEVPACVILGLGTLDELGAYAQHAIDTGYRYAKCKILPDNAVQRIELLQQAFPNLIFGIDANGSFQPANEEHGLRLKTIDALGVDFIEQPYQRRELAATKQLRTLATTPIFLDESLQSNTAARIVIDMGCCDGLTLKPALMGGFSECRQLADHAYETGVSARVGGMLETAVGRAAVIALAATEEFHGAPAEISPDGRWFVESIAEHEVLLHNGALQVPKHEGITAPLNMARIDELTLRSEHFQ